MRKLRPFCMHCVDVGASSETSGARLDSLSASTHCRERRKSSNGRVFLAFLETGLVRNVSISMTGSFFSHYQSYLSLRKSTTKTRPFSEKAQPPLLSSPNFVSFSGTLFKNNAKPEKPRLSVGKEQRRIVRPFDRRGRKNTILHHIWCTPRGGLFLLVLHSDDSFFHL